MKICSPHGLLNSVVGVNLGSGLERARRTWTVEDLAFIEVPQTRKLETRCNSYCIEVDQLSQVTLGLAAAFTESRRRDNDDWATR